MKSGLLAGKIPGTPLPAGLIARPAGVGRNQRLDPAFDTLVPASARTEKLTGDIEFTEGPIWIRDGGGYLAFSDIPANVIRKWTPDGKASIFRQRVLTGPFTDGQFVGPNALTLSSG